MLAAVKDAGGDRPSTALAADTVVDYDDAAYEREMKAARRQAAADRLAVIQRLNLIAYVNAAVLAFVAVGVGYELLHVDVEAILALFKYTLPEDRPMEDALAYRLATSVDLLARLPGDSIRGYEALVPTNPVFYKACTSDAAHKSFLFGDAARVDGVDAPRHFDLCTGRASRTRWATSSRRSTRAGR